VWWLGQSENQAQQQSMQATVREQIIEEMAAQLKSHELSMDAQRRSVKESEVLQDAELSEHCGTKDEEVEHLNRLLDEMKVCNFSMRMYLALRHDRSNTKKHRCRCGVHVNQQIWSICKAIHVQYRCASSVLSEASARLYRKTVTVTVDTDANRFSKIWHTT